MKTFFKILLLTLFIFSISKPSLLYITKYVIIIYTIIELSIFLLSKKTKNSLKSKLFFTNWSSTGAPNVYFNTEVSVTKVESLIKKFNLENPEKKIDLQLFVLRALGSACDDDPMYGNICFGNFTRIHEIDITVNKVYYQKGNVVYDEKEIYEKKKNDKKFDEREFEKKEVFHVIRNCAKKTVGEIREDFVVQKKKLLKEFDERKEMFEKINKYLPVFIVKLGMDLYIFLSYSFDFDFKFFGFEKKKFGKAYFCGPHREHKLNDFLMPFSKKLQSQVCLFMKNVREVPVILENGDFGTERKLEVCCTNDHRHGDGSALLKLIPNFKRIFYNPEKYL